MFGFSIFMNQDLDETTFQYMAAMTDCGFRGVFTSMHIPEDDPKAYKKRLLALGNYAKQLGLEVMVDISGDALERAGFSIAHPEVLAAMGITGLRMDYHIDNQTIAALSHKLKISLNASTLTAKDIAELQAAKSSFRNLEAWHNYYPRPETGLAADWFQAKNQWLKQNGFTVQAFVPGDDQLRGPLFEGLPTLEEHRSQHPLACALDLLTKDVDLVYIGDGGISPGTKEQFSAYIKEQTILLHAARTGSRYFEYVLGDHTNRQDDARDVLRSASARFRQIPQILIEVPQERVMGAVTVDNEAYLRYMGEIQIAKHDLPADPKVNVAAVVNKKDLPLLSQIKAGMNFRIESE